MRSLTRMLMALAAALALASTAPAGVYSTVEFDPIPGADFRVIRDRLILLRQMSSVLSKEEAKKTAAKTDTHKRFELVADLFAQNPAVKLTDEERLNLGAYLIRLGRYGEASKVLDIRKFKDRSNFLAYSSLATNDYLWGVTQNIPDKVRNASTNLQEALRLWPKDWNKLPPEKQKWFNDVGWGERGYEWYRACDEYLLKLLKLRRQPAKGGALGADVEPLFTKPDGQPVRFNDPDGNNYKVGGLAPAEKAALPARALEVVEQLLLWMPNDDRLFWLLGELFNAKGETASARDIFLQLGLKRKHYLDVLKLYGPEAVAGKNIGDNEGHYPTVLYNHIEALQQKQSPPELDRAAEPPPVKPPPPPKPPKPELDEQPLDLRTLLVGFGFGLVVAFFGYWQYHEIRRRRLRT